MSPVHPGKLPPPPFKYPQLIVPLDYVLALFYVFPSPTKALKRLTGNTSAAKEDATSSQRITGVSAVRMRTDQASGATEGLRSRDLNKRQQRLCQGDLTWTSKVNKLSQWNNLHITCHVKSNRRFLEKKTRDYFCPTVSVKDKLNRIQWSLQQSLVHAVPAYYLNQPSNVPSPPHPTSYPFTDLFSDFKVSASFYLLCSWKHGTEHNMKYCMAAGYK